MRIPYFPKKSAFTLVELLVVIAIIAVLASLLVPVISKIQDTANSTKCLANLRQIASAIGTYSGDNDNKLPGPLAQAQYPIVGVNESWDKGSLAKLLAKYLDVDPTPSASGPAAIAQMKANVFTCPAYDKLVRLRNGPAFVINQDKITQLDQIPFGDVEGAKLPVPRAVLTSWTENTSQGSDHAIDLSRVWAMKDADQEIFRDNQGARPDGFDQMSLHPVHGDHRNAIFYDLHVAKLPLEDYEFTVYGTRR